MYGSDTEALKASSVSRSGMSGGSAFQSLTVLGKKDSLFSVPLVIVWKALEWLCLVSLFWGIRPCLRICLFGIADPGVQRVVLNNR